MKNIYTWFSIGTVSFVSLLFSLFILPHDRKLTVSMAILCSLSLSVSILMIVQNRKWPERSKLIGDQAIAKRLVFPAIVWAIATLLFSLILELLLSLVYWFTPLPSNYKFDGVEYYQDNKYEDFRFGNEASLYLPAYEDFEGANVVEFTYYDSFLTETLYFPSMTEFSLKVNYEPEQYAMHKEAVCNQGADFGGRVLDDVWLLEKKKITFGNYLYYIVICNDCENTLTYLVSVQDHDKYSTYLDFPYPGA